MEVDVNMIGGGVGFGVIDVVDLGQCIVEVIFIQCCGEDNVGCVGDEGCQFGWVVCMNMDGEVIGCQVGVEVGGVGCCNGGEICLEIVFFNVDMLELGGFEIVRV